jgi:hypothetical protein
MHCPLHVIYIYIHIKYLIRMNFLSQIPSKKNFHFSTASKPILGPTQPPIHWVPGTLSPGVKRPWREADHSLPTSAKVNKTWTYTFTPQYIFILTFLYFFITYIISQTELFHNSKSDSGSYKYFQGNSFDVLSKIRSLCNRLTYFFLSTMNHKQQ